MKLFIDTNIFIYHLTQTGKWEHIQKIFQENELFTNTIVLNEVRYKLLWQEASESIGSTKKFEIQKKIKKDMNLRKKVYSLYLTFYFSFKKAGTIYPTIDEEEVSCMLSQQHGLLPADADILTTMRREGITTILTTDEDFNNIPGIQVLKP